MAEQPAVGSRWRNKHTGKEATVLAVKDEERREPTALAQAADGRFLFGNFAPIPSTIVRFEGGAPPGYNDAVAGGWKLDSFLAHWEPVGVAGESSNEEQADSSSDPRERSPST